MSDSLLPHGLQHPRLPWPSLTPAACSNSCPLSRRCHPIISSLGQLHHSYPLQHSFCLWASLSGRVVVLPRILAYWWWEEVVSLSLDTNQETCSLDSNGSHLKAWRRTLLKQCAQNLTTHTLNFPLTLGNFFVLLSTMHPTHKTS